jgi:hypothetical protein
VLHIVIDAVMTTSIAKWMIHGPANVLDGQGTNDAADLGSAPLGSPSIDRFAIGLCRGDRPTECAGGHVNHEQKDPPGSY